MNNILNRFYLFSKLTTSIILFIILVFLIFLFGNSFLNNQSDLDSLMKLEEDYISLSKIVNYNSDALGGIENIILENNEYFKNISSSIEILQKKPSDDFKEKLDKINNENNLLKNKILELSKKISELEDNNFLDNSDYTKNQFTIKNLIKLINIKFDNGNDIKNEVNLLSDFNFKNNKDPYIEKLQTLANINFYGLSEINNKFDEITSLYLQEYFLEKNNNLFIKYLSNVITVEPNLDGNVQDTTVKIFVEIKNNILDKNINLAVNKLILVDNNEKYFSKWIEQANYYIEFKNTLNQLIE